MQRLAQWKGKWNAARRQLSGPLLLRQGVGAAIGALCASLPLAYAPVTLCVPMCVTLVLHGVYAPLCFAATVIARLCTGALCGDAMLWYDAAAIALACIGAYIVQRVQKLDNLYIAAGVAAAALVLSRVFAVRLLALDWIVLAVQAAVCFLVYPVFSTALLVVGAPRARRILSQEETLCVCLTAAILLAGAAPIRVFGVSIAAVASYFAILLAASSAGVGLAAGCAAVMGTALAAGLGGQWMIIANVTVCAVICSVFRKMGRWACALSFILTNAVLTLAVNGSTQIILHLKETVPACIVFLCLPARILHECAALADRTMRRQDDTSRTLRRVQENVHARLCGVSDVFSQMASCFDGVQTAQESTAQTHTLQMMQRVYSQVCTQCALCNMCWKRDYDATYEAMYEALETARENGRFDARQMQGDFARRCMKRAQLIQCIHTAAGMYILQSRWQQRMDESRLLVAQQLAGVSDVMRQMADDLQLDACFDGGAERDIRVSLDRYGIEAAGDISVWKNADGYGVRVSFDRCADRAACLQAGAQAISDALGCRMRLVAESVQETGGGCVCTYAQSVAYDVRFGYAQRCADGETVSGDSCVVTKIDLSHRLLAVCDGMGNGVQAHAESSAAAGLIANFYRAGFQREAALRAVNRLLLLRSGEEMYSTVDLCIFDCAQGACQWTKIAAAPGLLRKNGRIHLVQTEALPMGVADTDVPDALTFQLHEGDGVLLFSDGVTDAVGEAALVSLCDALWHDCGTDAQALCDAVLEAALACGGGAAADDMSVAAGILVRS